MEFYCSNKFRVNSNQTRIDIWLIYKCMKCDATWKLSIKKGIRPHDLSDEQFDKYINNDQQLAWEFAYDKPLLKRHECKVQNRNIKYTIEGFSKSDLEESLMVHIKSPYLFELKLSTLLSGLFGMSIQQISKIVQNGLIVIYPKHDIMKYRIKTDITIFIQADILTVTQ